MDDSRTSPYSGFGNIGLFEVLTAIAVSLMMILLPIVFVVGALSSGGGDSQKSQNHSVTTTGSESSTTVNDQAESIPGLSYISVVIFDNMKIDVPEGAEEVETDEGICYATGDGSLRVQVVEIPDPDDSYPENIIGYCKAHDIDLQCFVDPEGENDFYAQFRETNEMGKEVFVEEDYNSYYNGCAYRVRVESEEDDDSISSHFFRSLASQ